MAMSIENLVTEQAEIMTKRELENHTAEQSKTIEMWEKIYEDLKKEKIILQKRNEELLEKNSILKEQIKLAENKTEEDRKVESEKDEKNKSKIEELEKRKSDITAELNKVKKENRELKINAKSLGDASNNVKKAYEILYRENLLMLRGEFYGVVAVLFIMELVFAKSLKVNVFKDLLGLLRGGIGIIFNIKNTAPLKALDRLNAVGHIATVVIPFLIVILILSLVVFAVYELRELYYRTKDEKRMRVVNAIITSEIYSLGLVLGAVAIFKMNVNIFLAWLILGVIIGSIRVVLINKKY